MSGSIIDNMETNGATVPEATEKEPDAISQEEVGWLFVQSYYTYMNKEPHRLHQFYTRKSIMVHGNEGERVPALVGQQQINKKIMELGFQDCKVLVSNVDSQPSSNGGLVIQVLGEMSNRGVPSQKFVQTFFLAEQKSGYFVLNDIFRFLKEDIGSEYDEEDLPIEEPVPTAGADGYVESHVTSQASHVPEHLPIPSSDTPGPESVEQDEATIQENFASHGGDSESPDVIIEEEREPAVEVPPPQSQVDEVPPVPLAPLPEPELHVEQEAPPVAAAPTGPVSWAALAAKRSAAVAAAPAAPPVAPAASPEPVKAVVTAPVAKPADEKKKPEYHSAYIKGINDKVNDKALREALSQFGPLKHFEVNRQKSCAFIDYADAATLKTALEAHIVIVGDQNIYIEERRRGSGNFGGHKANGDRPSRNAQGGRTDGDRRKTATANNANGQAENRNRNRNANSGKKSGPPAAGKQ
ncbi:hypothetical protein V1525DRAFT_246672 [Lipomyces kononenkoae]|uniref:Uncharacterized protein n=1 Tax=Lipomyces kononenkoae TaxID=34357 RepID=A0ACC3T920_LIPKO